MLPPPKESVLPEVRVGAACEGCVSYRQERVCRQDGGMAVRKLDSVPLCAMPFGCFEWHRGLQSYGFERAKKDDASERVAALRSAPHVRQLGRAERDLVGFGNAERPV